MGHLLKRLHGDDDFKDKLVCYIMSTEEEFDLNCSAARVLLNAMPGLESADVFKVYISNYSELTKTIGNKQFICLRSPGLEKIPCVVSSGRYGGIIILL